MTESKSGTGAGISRRTVLVAGAAVTVAGIPTLGSGDSAAPQRKKMEPKLVRVPTEEDIAKALKTAPKGISEATHRAHLTLWQGYANKTNEIRTALSTFENDPAKANQIYSAIRGLRVNYAFALGGYINHNVYFDTIGGEGGAPSGDLGAAIAEAFGSYDEFKKAWKTTGMAARGWAYLAWNKDENFLEILIGDSQDTFPAWNHELVLAMDVYEHAYFLDFQTARAKYIDAYFEVIDWNAANARLARARRG